MEGWWRWALVSPDGVAPSWMVSVSASVNLPLHRKVQKFSSGTGSPRWSQKKGRKTVVVVVHVSTLCRVVQTWSIFRSTLISNFANVHEFSEYYHCPTERWISDKVVTGDLSTP